MVVILVHWRIKADRTEEFEAAWRRMTVRADAGLFRETLTKIDTSVTDPKFNTFSIGDPFYATCINIGMWESLHAFDAAIDKYIPAVQTSEEDDESKQMIELEPFEFKLRERVVLQVVADRGGELPAAEMRP